MSVLGYITIILLVGVLALSLFMVVLAIISMRKGHFYLPWLLRPGLIVLEGVIKVLWRVGKINGNDLTSFTIRLSNQLNRERFSKIPEDRRLVFLPQCLRSADCPASLTTEGLVCKRCMRCDIGKTIDELQSYGCKVFIVPGSTFVTRLIKKYRPEAIVGVGLPHGSEGRARDGGPDRSPGHGRGHVQGRLRGDHPGLGKFDRGPRLARS